MTPAPVPASGDGLRSRRLDRETPARERGLQICPGDLAGGVGEKFSLAVVEEYEMVAPRVGDDCAPADRDVEGLHDDPSAGGDETLDCGPY
jgi:hypothetical protein